MDAYSKAIEYFDEDDIDEGSKVEFTFEKDHIQNVKKVKSIITKNGEKKEPETNENLK